MLPANLYRIRVSTVSLRQSYWCSSKTQVRRDCNQVGERVGLHFSHHFASVCLHRDLADAELETNLFIQQAGYDQIHDLTFASAE